MFLALSAAGCGAASGRTQHTVQGCAAYGLTAIKHHITVTWKPAPCQGLSKAEVNHAVAIAVVRASGDARKAIRRRRAGEAAPYLEYLVSELPPVAGSSPTGTRPVAASSGRDLPMGIAALIAWLVAAGSGAYVLGSWIIHGGTLQRRAPGAGTGSPPALLFGHFGLALAGLMLWVTYLVTAWAALAWAAVAVLLPVAGLGMATLVNGLPGRRAGTGGTGTVPTVPARVRLAPLVVAAHGALAVTTMILVLLAALGGAAS